MLVQIKTCTITSISEIQNVFMLKLPCCVVSSEISNIASIWPRAVLNSSLNSSKDNMLLGLDGSCYNEQYGRGNENNKMHFEFCFWEEENEMIANYVLCVFAKDVG